MIEIFHQDEGGYKRWISNHQPDGYVVDRNRVGTDTGGRLHKTTCHTIDPFIHGGNDFTRDRFKGCSVDASYLRAWLKNAYVEPIENCDICNP